ncbi:uncharacterized protein [Porites lutea]|uniref:uncharacterized protein isoform X2 n=1 Tax=Porites lutea TaxID=51062 RepID=UPI003CC5194E
MVNFRLLLLLIVFCSSVGIAASCSIETLQEKAKTCVNGFFDNLKKDRHQDCRKLYTSKVKHCIIKVIDSCRNRTDGKTVSSKNLISSWQYYCKDGMLYSFKGYKKLQNCLDTTLEKIGKCASSFYKKFKENKGSRSLCRKFTKAKKCIRTTLERNCDKNSWVKNAAKRYQDPHNPYCPGWVDLKRKPVPRSPGRRFGSCSESDYLSLTRVCIASFVQTLQKNPKTSCRRVYMDKINKCAKNVALHCHKNESKYDRRNVERSFNSRGFRDYQEQVYCNGMNLQVPLPPSLRRHQCSKNFLAEKGRCQDNYVKTYRENKADKSLCSKYAEAKACVKNATLTLCKMKKEQVEVVNFYCDTFNPFCFNLSDPPMVKQPRVSEHRVSRESGPQLPTVTPTQSVKGSAEVKSRGGGQSTSLASYRFVVILSVVVLIRTVS